MKRFILGLCVCCIFIDCKAEAAEAHWGGAKKASTKVMRAENFVRALRVKMDAFRTVKIDDRSNLALDYKRGKWWVTYEKRIW